MPAPSSHSAIPFTLDPKTTVGAVTLAVADLDGLARFYRDIIGLDLLGRTATTAVLGVRATPLLYLDERPDGRHYPRTPGLFHLALLVPSRQDLGHWLAHLVATDYPLDGAGDHLVSEALYLSDPEGNGIEVYRDRPRETWERDGDNVKMATLAVDLQGLLAEAPGAPFTGLPDETRMGHVHLKVDDVERAAAFYQDVLGLNRTAAMPGARFLSAGGYHHHVGLNTWYSRGAPPSPPDALGLVACTLLLPTPAARNALLAHLDARHVPVDRTGDDPGVRDPAGNAVVLAIA